MIEYRAVHEETGYGKGWAVIGKDFHKRLYYPSGGWSEMQAKELAHEMNCAFVAGREREKHATKERLDKLYSKFLNENIWKYQPCLDK